MNAFMNKELQLHSLWKSKIDKFAFLKYMFIDFQSVSIFTFSLDTLKGEVKTFVNMLIS